MTGSPQKPTKRKWTTQEIADLVSTHVKSGAETIYWIVIAALTVTAGCVVLRVIWKTFLALLGLSD